MCDSSRVCDDEANRLGNVEEVRSSQSQAVSKETLGKVIERVRNVKVDVLSIAAAVRRRESSFQGRAAVRNFYICLIHLYTLIAS